MAGEEERPLDEVLQEYGDLIGMGQAKDRACLYILMDVVRQLARNSPKPQAYLASMFERISARADQSPVESEGHPVTAEFRETIATFFSVAGHNL